MHVVSLHTYPIKSCAGISQETMKVGPRGPLFDREWMLVSSTSGEFLTQRQQARMAQVRTSLTVDTLRIELPSGGADLALQVQAEAPIIVTKIWGDDCEAYEPSPEASALLSGFLHEGVRLLRMRENFRRPLPAKHNLPNAHTSFTDSSPFLLTSSASLADLNAKLPGPAPMDRFRANIVIDGTKPFVEDSWKRLRIGTIEMAVVKACARCIIINTDQATGARGPEPLRSLSTYRRAPGGNQVLFGQYLAHLGMGELHVGDPVEILE